jgi:hypothetical protein
MQFLINTFINKIYNNNYLDPIKEIKIINRTIINKFSIIQRNISNSLFAVLTIK